MSVIINFLALCFVFHCVNAHSELAYARNDCNPFDPKNATYTDLENYSALMEDYGELTGNISSFCYKSEPTWS